MQSPKIFSLLLYLFVIFFILCAYVTEILWQIRYKSKKIKETKTVTEFWLAI